MANILIFDSIMITTSDTNTSDLQFNTKLKVIRHKVMCILKDFISSKKACP